MSSTVFELHRKQCKLDERLIAFLRVFHMEEGKLGIGLNRIYVKLIRFLLLNIQMTLIVLNKGQTRFGIDHCTVKRSHF